MRRRPPESGRASSGASRPRRTRSVRAGLKIFFGYAPGVGKTYTMLESAQRLKAQGVDVVVGLRRDPRSPGDSGAPRAAWRSSRAARSPTAGTTLEEFDLDGALARKPAGPAPR